MAGVLEGKRNYGVILGLLFPCLDPKGRDLQ